MPGEPLAAVPVMPVATRAPLVALPEVLVAVGPLVEPAVAVAGGALVDVVLSGAALGTPMGVALAPIATCRGRAARCEAIAAVATAAAEDTGVWPSSARQIVENDTRATIDNSRFT